MPVELDVIDTFVDRFQTGDFENPIDRIRSAGTALLDVAYLDGPELGTFEYDEHGGVISAEFAPDGLVVEVRRERVEGELTDTAGTIMLHREKKQFPLVHFALSSTGVTSELTANIHDGGVAYQSRPYASYTSTKGGTDFMGEIWQESFEEPIVELLMGIQDKFD